MYVKTFCINDGAFFSIFLCDSVVISIFAGYVFSKYYSLQYSIDTIQLIYIYIQKESRKKKRKMCQRTMQRISNDFFPNHY